MHTPVRTRIAPSPTGLFHIGTARSALYNFLFAKKNKGTFILRIEDTDKERSKKEYEDDIKESLEWLSLLPDEEYRQSERIDVHKKYLEQLVRQDAAYLSKEEGREVVRLRNEGKDVTFHDVIRGNITFNTKELGDFIIARSIESPLYHLAVVVDDHEMGISHIIRGEDHISNTPRQMLIQKALEFETPTYAHIPLILGKDRSKLSKRKGGVTVRSYKEEGYLPEALLNYLAFLGWSPEDGREMFTIEELIQAFDLQRIHLGGAAFDEEKLKWFNGEYLKKLEDTAFKEKALPYLPDSVTLLDGYSEERFLNIVAILKERISVFSDIEALAEEGELTYYFSQPEYGKEALFWKDESDTETLQAHLQYIKNALENIDENSWSEEAIKNAVWDYASEKGRGSVLWPMRYALSGAEKSPDPFTLAEVLGKSDTIARISRAINLI